MSAICPPTDVAFFRFVHATLPRRPGETLCLHDEERTSPLRAKAASLGLHRRAVVEEASLWTVSAVRRLKEASLGPCLRYVHRPDGCSFLLLKLQIHNHRFRFRPAGAVLYLRRALPRRLHALPPRIPRRRGGQGEVMRSQQWSFFHFPPGQSRPAVPLT